MAATNTKSLLCLLAVAAYAIAALENEPFKLTLLPEAANTKTTVCLDGSPSGYYFRPGTGSGANKWLLHLRGGGWCFRGVEECFNRSYTTLGSSKSWTSTFMFGGSLSSDETSNPTFYNWNMAFFMYCDGASFSADREDPDVWDGKKLYYRGFRILTAIMEDLNANRNLKQATDVVLTGCSAGGLAVYMHMNYIQTLIPPTARYSGLPDAGFFIDVPRYTKDSNVSDFFRNLIKFMWIENGLMDECRSDNPGDMIWKCMSPPHIYKYIKAPLLVLNSLDDTEQLKGLFNFPCLPPNCSSTEMDSFYFFQRSFLEQVSVVTHTEVPGSGHFLDSCLVHCQTMSEEPFTAFRVGGKSISQAVYDWYYNSTETKLRDCAYPCNPSCPGKYPPSS